MTCTLLITTTGNLVMIHIIIIIITILTHRVHATPSLQCLPAYLQPTGTYLPTCMYVCTYVVTTTNNKQQQQPTPPPACLTLLGIGGTGSSSRSVPIAYIVFFPQRRIFRVLARYTVLFSFFPSPLFFRITQKRIKDKGRIG